MADLAKVLQIDAWVLIASVEWFNHFQDQGLDEDFLRGSTEYQRANGDAQWGERTLA